MDELQIQLIAKQIVPESMRNMDEQERARVVRQMVCDLEQLGRDGSRAATRALEFMEAVSHQDEVDLRQKNRQLKADLDDAVDDYMMQLSQHSKTAVQRRELQKENERLRDENRTLRADLSDYQSQD